MSTTLQQLSIFLENKIGSLYEIVSLLGRADVRIIASTVADTSEFGILRIITSDNDAAQKIISAEHKNVVSSDVIAVLSDSSAEAIYDELRKFYAGGVVIEYMYSFSIGDKSVLIMRVDDMQKATKIAEERGVATLSNKDLTNL